MSEAIPIEVREARLDDIPWVRDLAVRSVVFGVPVGRDIPNAEVQAHVRRTLADLEFTFRRDPAFRILVAENPDTGERLGYLMLDLAHQEASTGEPQAMIHDLAVEPRNWGRYVVHRLVRRAAQTAHERGLRYMIGEVTADNRRTLVQALRLGFVLERHQIVMQCGPEGPLPMPGRPEAERAHDRSRKRPGVP